MPQDHDEAVEIRTPRLAIRVRPLGAELCSLRDAGGREFLWQAGAAWPRHAPILFPIVGRMSGDVLRLDTRRFPMGQHGIARDHVFGLVERGDRACRFRLTDSAATRAAYPFAFRLDVAYAVRDDTLAIEYEVFNPGDAPLPFSIGAHPAFVWPLPGAAGKATHRLTFERAETGPVYRPGAEGLLGATPEAWPGKDRDLALDEALFARGALVLLAPTSQHVRFDAPGASGIEVAWDGFAELGIWMKPGADFLCIEPWAGHADIAGQEGDYRRKRGIRFLAPGESRSFRHRVTLLG